MCRSSSWHAVRMIELGSICEGDLVAVCTELRAGRGAVGELVDAFNGAIIYTQRPERPGLMLSTVPDAGEWAAVFSSLERLGRFAGACEWQSMTGADLLDQIDTMAMPVSVMVDLQDAHAVALTPDTVVEYRAARGE